MNYSVYCIKSIHKKFKYIGFSKNVLIRLRTHNNGNVKSTKHYAPFKIIALKEFKSEKEAVSYEKLLKRNIKKKEDFLYSLKD